MFDSRLTWKRQINAVTKKVNRAFYGLRFIKSCLTEELRKRLVTALVIPHLDYCSSVVYLDASADLRTRIQRLINSCIRYIHIWAEDVWANTPYKISLGWLRTDTRRLYFAAIIMYKILRLNKPKYLVAFFQRYQSRDPWRSDRKDLAIPGVRMDTGLLSFQVKCAHLWKSLPSSVRDFPTLSCFKNGIYKHLVELDGWFSAAVSETFYDRHDSCILSNMNYLW